MIVVSSFSSVGFIADRLNTYVPSFIMVAATEYTAAALLLILVCEKKTQNYNPSRSIEEMQDDHKGVLLCETQV